MVKVFSTMMNICYLEELARRDKWINSVNPFIKFFITIFYIILVSSIEKYQLNSVLLLGVYPILLLTLCDIPLGALMGKVILPMIISINLGIFNPIFDRDVYIVIAGLNITGGWVSLGTLFFKSVFSITSIFILVSTTKIEEIAMVLKFIKLPHILITQLLLMYRYINVLIREVEKTLIAYQLRSKKQGGIHYSTWGSMVGQIFFRAYERSNDLYEAMRLRGFKNQLNFPIKAKLDIKDCIYLLSWFIFFVGFVYVNK